MRRAVVVCCVLWARGASAGPGVVIEPSVPVHEVPLDISRVIAMRHGGDPVCILDDSRGTGSPGWLGIRDGADGFGYVRRDAVDLSPPPAAADFCHDVDAAGPVAIAAAGTFLPRRPVRILLGLGSGAAWLRDQSAMQHHIGSIGPTFNATLGFSIEDIVSISGSGGATFPSDNATFDQDVVSLGGTDPSTETSHLEVQSYSVAAGLRTPFYVLWPTANGVITGNAFADGGWAYIHGVRSIEHCIGCRKDDLDMGSGMFWRVGFEIARRNTVPTPRLAASYGLSVAYQSFLDDTAGLTRELRIGLILWFL
jgi:hypothetical protein